MSNQCCSVPIFRYYTHTHNVGNIYRLISPILEQFNGSSKCIWSNTISSFKLFIDHDMIFVIADKAVIIIATLHYN